MGVGKDNAVAPAERVSVHGGSEGGVNVRMALGGLVSGHGWRSVG